MSDETDTLPDASGSQAPRTMTVRGAVFLGVGAMVGAGIFALLGEAGAVAGSAVWLSFLVAGLISSLLGYAVVKLGVRYPSAGGILTYLIEGFGNGRLVGIASWLGYFSAILLVCAMVAVSFGDYAASLFLGSDAAAAWNNVFASAVVLAMAALNVVGVRGVDRVQSVIVIALLAVFAVFIVATLTQLDPDLLAPSGYPSLRAILSSVALTFFAYLGFSVISFAAGDLPEPERNLPRAMYVALGATTALYVAISIGVFGTLTVAEVTHYGATAVAEAARPALGDAGFTAVTIAALLATSSSVNAVLYASKGFTGALAKAGQFPPLFGERSRLGAHGNLIDHHRAHPDLRQPVRPEFDRVGRQRRLVVGLRPRGARRLSPASRDSRQHGLAGGRRRRIGARPALLRDRHAAQRRRHLRRHRGHDRARGGARHRVEAAQGSPPGQRLITHRPRWVARAAGLQDRQDRRGLLTRSLPTSTPSRVSRVFSTADKNDAAARSTTPRPGPG